MDRNIKQCQFKLVTTFTFLGLWFYREKMTSRQKKTLIFKDMPPITYINLINVLHVKISS